MKTTTPRVLVIGSACVEISLRPPCNNSAPVLSAQIPPSPRCPPARAEQRAGQGGDGGGIFHGWRPE